MAFPCLGVIFFPENMRELCLINSSEKFHHFQYADGSYCRIDWLYLIKEPLTLTAFIFALFFISMFAVEGLYKIIRKPR